MIFILGIYKVRLDVNQAAIAVLIFCLIFVSFFIIIMVDAHSPLILQLSAVELHAWINSIQLEV